jgi:2,4-dienoyl-CoA reductase-like NADH-dependent reductase (Old Yellow Enzyme family)/thioredoxin reductase
MAYEKLYEPIIINGLEVKNRLVMTPFSNLFATVNGEVTQRTLDYYAARARGGVGLLIVEYSNVQPVGKGCIGTMLGCYSDKLIPGLSLLARTIKENGARAALQIAHAGRQTFAEYTETATIKAPSAIPLPMPGYPIPDEMTVDEIEETIEAFGDAALRVKNSGFDAVELHGAHGYLVSGFLSPLQNLRKDKYGGSLENRMRFAIEIVQRIREKVGPNFTVGCKISVDEYLDGGSTVKESAVVAKELERAGIDWLECSAGTYETVHYMVPAMYWSNNLNVHLAEAMKKVLNIPVMTLGRHGDPAMMEQIIAGGKADMIAMGRQLVCDPELPNKIKKGHFDDIRRCIGCNEGCLDYFFKGWPITCAINPEVGRESEYAIRQTNRAKKILVIGGGPAGMEAARVASLRGHDVTIFEQRDKLGGQLNVASIPDFKKPIRDLVSYQKTQLRKAGVSVMLGKEATLDTVRAFAPDVVIVATGARPIKHSIPGISSDFVILAADALRQKEKVGDSVLVVGGGYIGCETALFLAQQGKSVTVVEKMEDIAYDAEIGHNLTLRELLPKSGVALRTGLTLQEVKENGEAICRDKGNKEQAIKADTIVLATGYEADTSLAKDLEKHVEEVYTIGDCVMARNILGAFHDGARVGRQI